MPDWAGGRGRLPRRRGRGGRTWLYLLVLVVAALLAWLLSPADARIAAPPAGSARAVDGDTLRLADWRVRLRGIDAPELAQSCTDRAGAAWPCGERARQRLAALVARREVSCNGGDLDRYGRLVATCRAGGDDLARVLVDEGLAMADDDYAVAGLAAKVAGRGIWSGRFDRPADWRRTHAGDADEGGRPSQVTTFLNWVGNMFDR